MPNANFIATDIPKITTDADISFQDKFWTIYNYKTEKLNFKNAFWWTGRYLESTFEESVNWITKMLFGGMEVMYILKNRKTEFRNCFLLLSPVKWISKFKIALWTSGNQHLKINRKTEFRKCCLFVAHVKWILKIWNSRLLCGHLQMNISTINVQPEFWKCFWKSGSAIVNWISKFAIALWRSGSGNGHLHS